MKKITLNIGGMHCAACSAYLEKELSKMNGVDNVSVSIATNTATFEYDDKKLTIKDINKTVKSCGFFIDENKKESENKFDLNLTIIIVFSLTLMYVSMGHMLGLPTVHSNMMVVAYIQIILLLPVLICGREMLFDGFKALFKLHPNMNSLVTCSLYRISHYKQY